MELFHLLFVSVAFAAGAVVATRSARMRRTLEDLDRLAIELGFTVSERAPDGGTIRGCVEGLDAFVELHAGRESTTVILGISAPDTFPADTKIALDPRRPIGLESDLGVTAAYVDGELVAIARDAHFFGIDRGRAVLHWRLDILESAHEIDDRLQRFARWARHATSRSATLPERLAETAMHNPDPGTRIRALRALRSCYPDTRPAREARRAGLDDPQPEVRVEAATRLGPDGIAVLADVVRDTKAPRAARVRAMERIGAEAPRGVLSRVFFDVAFDAERQVSVLALESLAVCADDRTAARIIAMARLKTLDEDPLIALAGFLGARGGEDAAALLVSLLEVRSEPKLIAAASEAAVALGPGVAARALTILKERPRLATLRETRRAIELLRVAIGQHQRGNLAFVEPDAGNLSVSSGDE